MARYPGAYGGRKARRPGAYEVFIPDDISGRDYALERRWLELDLAAENAIWHTA